MNTDFRIRIGFFRHRKTRKLQKSLGAEGVLALLRLWEFAAESRSNGDLSGLSDEDIALSICWESDQPLMPELVRIGFVDGNSGDYRLHDWQDHNAWAADAEERSGESRLSRLFRTNPEKAKELKAQGRTSITQDEYQALKNPEKYDRSTTVVRPYNERTTVRSSPAPAPTPTPTPTPAPAPFIFSPQAPQEPAATVAERQPEPPTAEKKEKKGGKDSCFGKTTIADDWEPKASTIAGLAAIGIDADHARQQVAHFRLHHAEAGTLAKGFEALFVGWCKRAPKPEAKANADPLARRPGETLAEASDRRSQEYWGAVPPDERIDLDGSTIPVRKCYDKYLTH